MVLFLDWTLRLIGLVLKFEMPDAFTFIDVIEPFEFGSDTSTMTDWVISLLKSTWIGLLLNWITGGIAAIKIKNKILKK